MTSQGGIAGSTGFANVTGVGVVHSVGYEDTAIIWNFHTQDSAIIGNCGALDSFTFTSTHISVPDGGVTIALLGLALTGAGLFRKRLVA